MKSPSATGVRKGTRTSTFGAGRREAHDSSSFYQRFASAELSSEEAVSHSSIDGLFIHGDARQMGPEIPDGSVALVVTSPPYFAGKQYELAMGTGGIPASYFEYLKMLESVLRRCVRKLEPGGRMAINVANLGRRPYRSLSSDVIKILQDDLALLLRGEIIWVKGKGQTGSCAWGTYRSAANPTLRDLTERVIVASNGRFDRALARDYRSAHGLPNENTLTPDEFMEATLDVWEIPTISAKKIGHPAPFPVELPQRLIELFTYRDDLVLDPFIGSGSTAVAAARTGRRVAGYDTDDNYIALTCNRFEEERNRLKVARRDGTRPGFAGGSADESNVRPSVSATADRARNGSNGRTQAPVKVDPFTDSQSKTAKALARSLLEQAGFEIIRTDRRVCGVPVSIVANDRAGVPWYFDVTGRLTSLPSGLSVAETMWKSLGKAAVMEKIGKAPFVLLTSTLPQSGSELDRALRAGGPSLVLDAIRLPEVHDYERLNIYAKGGREGCPVPGFWS